MFTRTLATVVVAASLMSTPAASSAATAGDNGLTVNSQDRVVVNGRSYGPEEGLVVEEGEVTLTSKAASTAGKGDVSTYGTSTFKWGSSYTSSTESLQLKYTGKAYAAANVYSSKRIIQVCFRYTRGNKNVTGWICSNASTSGSRWVPGKVASKSIWDSLNPSAPKTVFHYKKAMIDPRVI